MSKVINASDIPSVAKQKKVEKEKITLKNVLVNGGKEDIEVEVIPFDCYDDQHVAFAFAYSDMLFRAPSDFRTVADAAKAYVRMFMVHTEEDFAREGSKINKVLGDVRACRTLFHEPKMQKSLNDFFENA